MLLSLTDTLQDKNTKQRALEIVYSLNLQKDFYVERSPINVGSKGYEDSSKKFLVSLGIKTVTSLSKAKFLAVS